MFDAFTAQFAVANANTDADTIGTGAGLDGGGINEAVLVYSDTDIDELFDTQQMLSDIDGGNVYDTIESFSDSEDIGYDDQITAEADVTADDIADIILHDIDVDGDGVFDIRIEEFHLDVNGDGHIDTVIFSADEDNDGFFETLEIYQDQDEDGMFELVLPEGVELEYIDPSGYSVDFDMDVFPNYNPDASHINHEAVVGDPDASMQHWEFQGDTNRCALHAQQFIIEELTGNEIDIEEFEQIAQENGWFDDGTSQQFMNKMLDYYGIENEMTMNNDLSDISECLNNGGKVIVAIDADEVWYPDNGSVIFAPDNPNHAVEVIGVDYTDPTNPMVILNDSGHPDGCGSMIPADQFVDAWNDSGCQMIAAY